MAATTQELLTPESLTTSARCLRIKPSQQGATVNRFYFYRRDTGEVVYNWLAYRPTPDAVDCTDMSDDEFEAHVRANQGV